jgi:hypothetical protein
VTRLVVKTQDPPEPQPEFLTESFSLETQQSRLCAEDPPRLETQEGEERMNCIYTGGRLAAFLLGIVACGCDRSGQMRSALDAERSGWSQRTAALRARESDLEVRFQALPPPPLGEEGVGARARRHRLEASIAASRQTLTDIGRYAEDTASEIESAIGRDETEGEDALSGARVRMGEHLRRAEEELATSEATVIQLAGP